MNIKEIFEAPVADIILATSQPGISTPDDEFDFNNLDQNV